MLPAPGSSRSITYFGIADLLLVDRGFDIPRVCK
jgi:hypothetical protein